MRRIDKTGRDIHRILVESGTMKIETLAAIGICAAIFYILRRSVLEADISDRPWSAEIEKSLHQPDAVLLCHHCLLPQENGASFCPQCHRSVGPYNTSLPFIYVFTIGEALRSGVTDRFRPTPVKVVGYYLFGLCNYMIFAPVYWYYLMRNLRKQKTSLATEDSEVS